MFKKRRSSPGSSPATLTPPSGDGSKESKIQMIQYDQNDLVERDIEDHSQIAGLLDPKKVTWINVDGLGDIETIRHIGELFGFHPLALEDVLNFGQRPKAEESPTYLFLVVQMVYHNKEKRSCGEQVSFFLGDNFVVTFQEEATYDVFDPVRARIRTLHGSMRKSKADYLTYALLDSIIDHYYPVLESLGAAIEELESQLLDKPSGEMVHTLHSYKRDLTHLRRLLWPLRDVVNFLMHDTSGKITSSTGVYLRDCYDHVVQLMDFVESCKEISAGLMELYHSSVAQRTSEVMRVLTVITSIFIPLTFVVGVYGMNFAPESLTGEPLPLNMPELYQPHGYIGVMTCMALVAITQIIIFRKMKWL